MLFVLGIHIYIVIINHFYVNIISIFSAIMERVCREQDFLGWFITSAKNGDCINDGFNTLMSKIIDIQKAKESVDENLDSKKSASIKLQSKTFKISKNMNGTRPRFVDTDCC